MAGDQEQFQQLLTGLLNVDNKVRQQAESVSLRHGGPWKGGIGGGDNNTPFCVIAFARYIQAKLGVPEAVASRLKDHEAAAAAAGDGGGGSGGGRPKETSFEAVLTPKSPVIMSESSLVGMDALAR
ncbi:hypothetical protein E2C01_034793 [Portunus trituberculatus]|uniref:Uncharacterized protein n=1 Tax=Portunus trituberculatus TaxID=210409 RepID=A0A5B7F7A4_PORTR|nr:hypothetical protein [Portunus trituberculatus]